MVKANGEYGFIRGGGGEGRDVTLKGSDSRPLSGHQEPPQDKADDKYNHMI